MSNKTGPSGRGEHSPSNARELAAAVTARTEPSDPLIIAPEWPASSFNYYYALLWSRSIFRILVLRVLSNSPRYAPPPRYEQLRAVLFNPNGASRDKETVYGATNVGPGTLNVGG